MIGGNTPDQARRGRPGIAAGRAPARAPVLALVLAVIAVAGILAPPLKAQLPRASQQRVAVPGGTQFNLDLLRPSGGPVIPIFEGWYRMPDGSYALSFGYFNVNTEEILEIPLGPDNFIEPSNYDGVQPTHFLPVPEGDRRHWGVFTGAMIPMPAAVQPGAVTCGAAPSAPRTAAAPGAGAVPAWRASSCIRIALARASVMREAIPYVRRPGVHLRRGGAGLAADPPGDRAQCERLHLPRHRHLHRGPRQGGDRRCRPGPRRARRCGARSRAGRDGDPSDRDPHPHRSLAGDPPHQGRDRGCELRHRPARRRRRAGGGGRRGPRVRGRTTDSTTAR